MSVEAMVKAVFGLFILFMIGSIVNPEIDKATAEVTNELAKQDTTGSAAPVLAVANVPDPVGDVKTGLGGVLLRLLETHPVGFLLLVVVVALILLSLGFTANQVRGWG